MRTPRNATFTRRARRSVIALALLAVCPLFLAAPAAGVDFGLRGGVYTDQSDPFAGVELLAQIGSSRWYFNPNAEYVFVEYGDLVTANADVHYDFVVGEPVYIWAGAGLALIFRDRPPRRDDTDAGVNLLAGVGFKPRGSSVRPYIQGKLILADETEGVIAFGIRF